MFRSSALESVGLRDETFRWLGDFDYWLRVGLAGPMARVPGVMACWRRRNGQASRDYSDDRAAEHVRAMEKFYSQSQARAIYSNGRAEAMCWAHLVAGSISGSWRTALSHFWQGIQRYPRVLIELQTYDTVAKRLLHAWRKR
jgi:hypothetical protein